MRILEDLWYGNLSPSEQMALFENERGELLELCERNRNALMATLNDGQKELLEKLYDLWVELQQNGQRDAFTVGFRLGVQLMTASVWNPPER